ncbi:UDP-glucose 4-epimerase GalE [Rhodospirillaceae bacterium SYSU D60014]|uniref:UDP-glucose 4-epimerase GalE n=1 Tax=Virgifigura deserti TaxID=2268457 RepID=UPI000E6689CD
MSKSLLVTGGAGYVGSHVVLELVARGYEVVVFDNLQQGHRDAVVREAMLIEGDLADRDGLDRLFDQHRFDAVLHFAANSLVGESMRQPFLYLGDNVVNALNLIRATVEHKVGKFVLSSTANLFGTPERIPIDEEAAIDPGSPYGESKFIIERMLHWADQIHGLRSACLRYFNAAGADPNGRTGEDHAPETHLIPIVLQAALGQRPHVEIFGDDYPTPDGTCIRDYIHVLDLADAHIRALDLLETRSCRYNLGNGRGYSVREVVETARRVTGAEIPVRVGPRRAGDPAVLVAAADRIRTELGWKPKFAELRKIVETAWQWHSNNPTGFVRARSDQVEST